MITGARTGHLAVLSECHILMAQSIPKTATEYKTETSSHANKPAVFKSASHRSAATVSARFASNTNTPNRIRNKWHTQGTCNSITN
jgi:hypothetical protein